MWFPGSNPVLCHPHSSIVNRRSSIVNRQSSIVNRFSLLAWQAARTREVLFDQVDRGEHYAH